MKKKKTILKHKKNLKIIMKNLKKKEIKRIKMLRKIKIKRVMIKKKKKWPKQLE